MILKKITNSSAEYEADSETAKTEATLLQKKIAEIESRLASLKSILDAYTDEKVIEISNKSDVYNKTEINSKLENYLEFEVVEEIEDE